MMVTTLFPPELPFPPWLLSFPFAAPYINVSWLGDIAIKLSTHVAFLAAISAALL